VEQNSLDKSELGGFFHARLPGSTPQQEGDSRIFAASKWIFSFDQMRVVHEMTTDTHEIIWAALIEESSVLVTASQRNVIIWDALLGSKTIA